MVAVENIVYLSCIRRPTVVENEYTVEYAQTGRSKCRLSEDIIEKGLLRIGVSYVDAKTNKIFHEWCKWDEFKSRPLLASELAETD
jgi:hypothetical protein